MRDIGWSAMVCGIHTRMGARAVPQRNECGREPTESHYGGKEEGCPWLVGSTALSAGTLEEGLVLNLAIASFAKPFILDSPGDVPALVALLLTVLDAIGRLARLDSLRGGLSLCAWKQAKST